MVSGGKSPRITKAVIKFQLVGDLVRDIPPQGPSQGPPETMIFHSCGGR